MGSRLRWRLPARAALPPERRLGKDAVVSLLIHSCFQFGASMSGLFLNLYLWRLTESLTVNGLYNIISFGITPAAFALGGWLAKRKDRMVAYRLGIVMIAIFYLLVVIAQENVAEFFVLFALLNGISSGFYWVGYLVLQYDVSTEANRIRYLAFNMICFNSAGLAGPALAGFIIRRSEGLQGYIVIFALAFLMFVIAAAVSFRIPFKPDRHRTYYLKLMGLLMGKNRRWLLALYGFLVFGLFQGVMLFLPNILLFRTVGREDWVGYLGVFFSALTVATGYVISRSAQKEQVHKYLLLSSSGVTIGASLLLIDVSLWSVVGFMMLFSIFNPLAVNTLTSYYYRLIGTLPLKGNLRVESVIMRELFLNAGRVISIGILLLAAGGLQPAVMAGVLVAMAGLQFLLLLLVRRDEPAPAHGEG
ncbi:MFS transporter [Paenibacillus albicereus]|uniref:MFS transporter n=1 Tax=Paenibacillus albicereus TaxID=2726185 RepID=A0A6H2GZA1_9BACL|nr:MFS transporter [Paenibacillus albicereus]QJC52722.1 MFS transporter [Paenibacillus albicereus]